MTKTVETVYTAEVVERMTEAYRAAESDEARATVVAAFAEELGVTLPSVRAKLVSLGVYVAKTRTTKNGESVETKANIVADIAKAMGVAEEVLESLEKATKPVLKRVRDAISTAD